ncbi:MAG: hypothetical protein ABI661_08215 [Gammaproteobacteria bacterium]
MTQIQARGKGVPVLEFRELDSVLEAWRPIVSAAKRGTVTLIYSSHDERDRTRRVTR